MLWVDQVNSLFVLCGVILAWVDVCKAYDDREIKGMSLATAMLFTAWPIWDVFYYHSLGQTTSVNVCSVLVLMRITWLTLLLRGKR